MSFSRITSISAFPAGVTSVFGAIGTVFSNSGLKRYLVLPFIMNILLLGAIIYCSIYFLYPTIVALLPQGTEWYLAFFRVFAKIFVVLFTIIAAAFIYSIIGMAICAPFIEPISEKIEYLVTGRKDETPFSFLGIFRDISRALKASFSFFIFFILFNFLLLFLNLIPVAGNLIYAVVSFMSVLFFLGFQMFDSVFSRKGFTFWKKMGTLWKIKWASMGIGFGFIIITYIPIVGFLSPVLSAAAATELYFRGQGDLHG
jgi:CysZ protein